MGRFRGGLGDVCKEVEVSDKFRVGFGLVSGRFREGFRKVSGRFRGGWGRFAGRLLRSGRGKNRFVSRNLIASGYLAQACLVSEVPLFKIWL